MPSPNFGPRPASTPVDLVVLHSISLPPGQYGGDAIERLFTNRLDWDAHPYYDQIRGMTVSAHFLVRRGGELIQFVSCDDRAWHAGASSWDGRDDCNDFSIGIELEGLEGDTFEEGSTLPSPRCSRAWGSVIRFAPWSVTSTSPRGEKRTLATASTGRTCVLSRHTVACVTRPDRPVAGFVPAGFAAAVIGDNRFVTKVRVTRYR